MNRLERRAGLATAAATVVLALGAAACGGDEPPDASAERIPISTVDYGRRPADVGPPAGLNRLANLYATLQRRFRAGDMAGVCVLVSPVMLDQFPPDADADHLSCPARLTAYARRLRRRGDPRPRLTIEWLRTYDSLNIGGITASDERGRRLRIPFQREGGVWKLRLGGFARPDTLNGSLRP